MQLITIFKIGLNLDGINLSTNLTKPIVTKITATAMRINFNIVCSLNKSLVNGI